MRKNPTKPQPRPRIEVALSRLRTLALIYCCCALPHPCQSQESRPTDTQVKAAYLYNFGKFVRWRVAPAGNSNLFEICVIGRNPFGSVLEATVAGEKIDGKSVVVTNLSSSQDNARCKLLYVSSTEEKQLSAILGMAKRTQALTVSDIPGFAKRGGMIEFVTQEDRIRFEVNLAPIDAAGLSVSSELLKVATKVLGVNPAKADGR